MSICIIKKTTGMDANTGQMMYITAPLTGTIRMGVTTVKTLTTPV